ncbi:unnamed protein product [Periconia digitata]|uniref:Uncharacterized protein n=1 Tax=Periconia digitata TaxID=1303443 RepID=A0A9W4UP76_9PLEO|nr:unnamed protein product [Periconia digitata]
MLDANSGSSYFIAIKRGTDTWNLKLLHLVCISCKVLYIPLGFTLVLGWSRLVLFSPSIMRATLHAVLYCMSAKIRKTICSVIDCML